MERIQRDITYLQTEINSVQREMFGGIYLVVALMVLVYAAGVITNNVELYKLVLMLAATGAGIFALNHYKTDSNAYYIRLAQTELRRLSQTDESSAEGRTSLPDYETWKSGLRLRAFAISMSDVVAAAVAIYVIANSAVAAWSSDLGMVVGAMGLFFLGVVIGVASKLLAGK